MSLYAYGDYERAVDVELLIEQLLTAHTSNVISIRIHYLFKRFAALHCAKKKIEL